MAKREVVVRASPEHEDSLKERVQACKCTDVKRTKDNEVVVLFANGGHLRLVSDTPIKAFIKAEEDQTEWVEE